METKIFTVLRTWLISAHKKNLLSISCRWSEKHGVCAIVSRQRNFVCFMQQPITKQTIAYIKILLVFCGL